MIALERGLTCSTAGGTHHAGPDYGSGFCLINDLAVAAKYIVNVARPRFKVLIVDLDVHQVGVRDGKISKHPFLSFPRAMGLR